MLAQSCHEPSAETSDAASKVPAYIPTPRFVRIAVVGTIGTLLAVALYLISVRGDALVLDLSKLGAVFCL